MQFKNQNRYSLDDFDQQAHEFAEIEDRERIHVWCDAASADILKVSLRKTETCFANELLFNLQLVFRG